VKPAPVIGRKALQPRTIQAIIREAALYGAVGIPVYRPDGKPDEVFLYRDGGIVATVFTPLGGRMAVRRPTGKIITVGDVQEAVQRGLDG
jgi:hypothetical protein